MFVPAMRRVGGDKKWVGTLRPKGVMVVVVMAILVLLSATAGQAYSLNHICPIHKHNVMLFPYETVYFGTNSLTMSVKMEGVGCVNDTQVFNLSNETFETVKYLKWYELNFINCENYVTKIGSEVVKFKHEIISPHCIDKLVTLSVGPDVQLGRDCKRSDNGRKTEQSKVECLRLLEGTVPDTSHSPINKPTQSSIEELFHLLDESKKYDSLTPVQLNPLNPVLDNNRLGLSFDSQFNLGESEMTPDTPPSYDINFSKRWDYNENAIPIFIGIVAFTVSMCLRFCLCRGKSVVRRITTVTVIRSRPVGDSDEPQDQQDPPPSYVDVVNEAPSSENPADEGCTEPPPPAYADIVDEVQPPTYSEVEAQSVPASEEVPLADREAETHTTQPPDPESAPDTKGSAPSKNLLSKYRSQQKQFAFKVLDEDD